MLSAAAPDSATNVPVNTAPPNWQCPHCLTKYHQDLQTATECAQAGPLARVTERVPVLALTGTRHTAPLFGLTEVGPVKAVKVDGRRDVVVLDGTVLDPSRVPVSAVG